MKTFEDTQGRTWQIDIHVGAVKIVKDLLQVNLLELVEGKDLLERIATDPVFLCDLVYCLCKEQADAQEITDEQFGRAMAGDAIDHATTALLEELVDFFPLGKRGVLSKALVKLKKLETRAIDHAEQMLTSSVLDERLERDLALADSRLLAFGSSSGSLPASSESIPDH